MSEVTKFNVFKLLHCKREIQHFRRLTLLRTKSCQKSVNHSNVSNIKDWHNTPPVCEVSFDIRSMMSPFGNVSFDKELETTDLILHNHSMRNTDLILHNHSVRNTDLILHNHSVRNTDFSLRAQSQRELSPRSGRNWHNLTAWETPIVILH